MRREYHTWWSHQLGREMPLLTFGHAGPPYIVFPTSMGAFFEYEDRGMVGALADKLDNGALQLVCVSTHRHRDVLREVDPAARPHRPLPRLRALSPRGRRPVRPFERLAGRCGVTGCSFGAYHAFTMALRHPDVFTACVTMGGAFDITRFLDGYYDRGCVPAVPAAFSAGSQRRVVPRSHPRATSGCS